MTEREWLTASDPEKMLARLGNQVSTRKLRLFACTGLRRYRNLLKDENSKRGLRVAERYADGQVSLVEMQEAHDAVLCYLPCITAQEAARSAVFWATSVNAFQAAFLSARSLRSAAVALALGRIDLEDQGGAVSIRIAEEERHQEGVNQASLLRCLFGNPFLPETILDSTLLGWKGGLVQRIAQGIYDNWAFDRLPYLAETLVEAGCGDETLFGHCRTAGLHGRGCWVVDLLLGKN